MKRTVLCIVLASTALTVSTIPVTASSLSRSHITFRLLSAGPKSINPVYNKKKKFWSDCVLSFRVRVTGIRLTAVITKHKVIPGKGNIEIFASSIPAGAYRGFDVPNWLGEPPAAATGTTAVFYQCVIPAYFHDKRGRHTLLAALGKTNGVLYRGVKPVKFTFDLK